MHVIRLRGNWSLRPLSDSGWSLEGSPSVAEGEATLVEEPAQCFSQLDSNFQGRVRVARRFHAPTGIAPNDVVAIAFEHCGLAGCVLLDGVALADFDSSGAERPILFSHDIRQRLQRGHELAIEIDWPTLTNAGSSGDVGQKNVADPVIGTVRLEIRSA